MTDYKGIHEKIRQRDYDYRSGWDQESVGLGIFIGIVIMGAIAVVGLLA